MVAEEQQGETRYRMLETLRQYSAEKLRETDEERPVHSRHVHWFLELAEHGVLASRGSDRDDRQRRLQWELDNCRAALSWSRREPE
jgi:predicted ATPase